MEKYKILDHKADLKIKVFGKNKKELFENGMKAMVDYLSPTLEKEKVKRKIRVKSIDFETLLVDFLNELLYYFQTKKEVYFEIKIKNLTEKVIEAYLFGNKIKSFSREIKAATYHNLKVKKNKFLEAVILFDI